MDKIIKIAVEGNYAKGNVTHIRATQKTVTRAQITRRQYESAMLRLKLINGDYLRLAPCGKHDVDVRVLDGNRDWAIIS